MAPTLSNALTCPEDPGDRAIRLTQFTPGVGEELEFSSTLKIKVRF